MFYFDAHSGRRRRARVRDRFAHAGRIFRRDVPRTIERKGRFFGGVARGVRHDAAEMLPLHMRRQQPVDDETLVARVRSEAFRDGRIKAGELHVDAYEGCVTLRGQLDESLASEVLSRTRRIEGVAQVRSYLHAPGTPAPNKAEAYAAAYSGDGRNGA
jgi:osmotically-inducible protein OsmY